MASSSELADTSNAISTTEVSLLPGFKDVNEFSQAVLKATMNAVRCGNELPSPGDDFDYFSSFSSFQHFLGFQKTRLLQLIQSVMKYHGARGNIAANNELMDIDDRFDVLVDANDQLLERVGTLLDEAAGLRKKDAELVVVTKTPKQALASGGWNKQITPPSRSRSTNSYRLLTSRHVTRPQIQFKDKIDNSYRPFRPKIVDKPNALQPLSESLTCEIPEDQEDFDSNFQYPHPYHYELENYAPDPKHLERANLQPSLPLETTPLTVVRTEDELRKLSQLLKQEKEFAVDLEHHSYRSYLGIACLIQISTRTNDYIIDALLLRQHIHILNDSFTDPNILKVFHGCDQDVMWLQRDFGVYLVGVFDTHQASRALGFARHRLQDLLRHYCNVETNKELQLEDWRIRPLPSEFLLYARTDTHYLLYIYDCLKNDLLHRAVDRTNLLLSVFQRSTQICARKYTKPHVTEESYKDLLISHRKMFNPQQIEALRGIYMWRDRIARQEDESTGYVLPNLMMLQIAELLPRESEGILACCTHIPPLVQQHLAELHHIVKTARERPTPKKDVVKPATFQVQPRTPQLNYCPHDLSHQSQPATDALIVDGGVKVETCDKPALSAFTVDPLQPAAKTTTTTAQQRAAQIQKSFINPFTKYLTVDNAQQSTEDFTELSTETASVWKLLPHTDKQTIVSNTKQVQVLETAAKISFNTSPSPVVTTVEVSDTDTDTDSAVTVRQQLNAEKTASVDSPCTSALKKQKRKHTVFTDPSAPPVEFVPHDYGKVNLSQLLQDSETKSAVKKKKKKREFDATLAIAESDFKSVSKNKPIHHTSTKSMTYTPTTGNSVTKIPWPKR